MAGKLCAVMVGLIALVCGLPAAASVAVTVVPPFTTSYAVTLPLYGVTTIFLQERQGPLNATGSWPYAAAPGPDQTVFGPPEPKTIPVTGAIMLGITTDILPVPPPYPPIPPFDPHLVLFTSDAFAAYAVGQSFETLFPGASEAELISLMQAGLAPGVPFFDPASIAAREAIDVFLRDQIDGIPANQAAWITGTSFTAIAFSDAQIIGTGTVSSQPVNPPVTDVPEPAGLGLLGLAFAGLSLARRRHGSGEACTMPDAVAR